MATSVPALGKGLALKRGDGLSPQQFTTLTMVRSISAFGEEKPLVEITHFQSVAREYINGLADGKEYQVIALFLPEDDTQDFGQGVLADYQNDDTRDYRMYVPADSGGGYFYFAAVTRAWEFAPSPANALEITFTMKITGGVQFQEGA